MKWTSKTPWTDEQLQAITCESGKGDIIVSAAAGSGKTTVLVERIIKNVIEQKTAMDHLLVVTFTEAAASEMRERIIDSLKSKRDEMARNNSYEDMKYLDEQIFLSETADIMTIDAFCNRIVSNNYHILGIDPNIRIGDNSTLEMLKDQAIEKLFNEMYSELYENDPNNYERTDIFENLIECYGTDRDDNVLGDFIKAIYKFAVSFKDVYKWLERSAELYLGSTYGEYRLKYVKQRARKAKDIFDQYKKIFDSFEEQACDDKNYVKLKGISEKLSTVINMILNISQLNELADIDKEYFTSNWSKFDTLSKNIKDEYIKESCMEIASDAQNIKENIKTLCKETVYGEENSKFVRKQIKNIVFIVDEFIKKYEAEKRKLNVFEFSDIEHKAYELFKDNHDIREFYKAKYDEILIDEYQDTNELQDSLFEIISKRNRFMVGDLKQSIYRFRGGDPYIFKEKSDRFGKDDNDDIKITLSQNFRSRQEVLRGVNDIFCKVMSDEVGDVDYMKEQLCRFTENKEYGEPAGCTEIKNEFKPEMHYLYYEKSNDNTGSKKDYQVIFIADKIREILDSGVLVYDKNIKGKRPIMKKDIVILERSVKDNGADLVSALSERGVEAYVTTISYFKRREIVIMMCLINIINNSLQDIPFTAVMRSPIWGFTDDELVYIRYNYPRPNMVQSMCSCAYSEETATGSKCKRAYEQLEQWRKYVRKMSVAQLIWSIYEETGFFDIMGAIDEGEEAQFNLKVLYEKAYQYEKTGFKGLTNFIRYIEREESNEESIDGVSLIGEDQDVVRIMTFHKSKGLEFPYVFVANLGKKFRAQTNMFDMLHKDFGIGIKTIDTNARASYENDAYDVIKKQNRLEYLSEELRLLYVALTRAKEKLFAVASVLYDKDTDEEEILKGLKARGESLEKDKSKASAAKGYFDWICPAASISPDTWEFNIHNMTEYTSNDYEEAIDEDNKIEINEAEVRAAIDRLMNYKYSYTELSDIPARVSVTHLKERSMLQENTEESNAEIDAIEENEPENRYEEGERHIKMQSKPKFMRKGELSSNEKGTIYHLIMSKLDYDLIRKNGIDVIEDECKRLIDEGMVRERDMKTVCRENIISSFFETDIGKRALASKRLYREKPFQLAIPLKEYDPELDNIFDENGQKKYSGETIILQGIIDMFFEEDDGIVLVDYKTDSVAGSSSKTIKERYKKQLELYSEAIEKLTGKKVRESVLYLAKTGETV